MPRAGIEPARPFRAKGFSYHCGFHHQAGWAVPVWGLDYSFTIGLGPLGVSCLVSAPSSLGRLGSRLPSARPGKVSLNLRHSTSLLSESALKLCLSPSCLPFHHQGDGRSAKGAERTAKIRIISDNGNRLYTAPVCCRVGLRSALCVRISLQGSQARRFFGDVCKNTSL